MKPKTQSLKIRNILFRLWELNNEGMTVEEYYNSKTNKYIDFLMKKLNELSMPKEESYVQ